jgi:uncharacterized membrane protein
MTEPGDAPAEQETGRLEAFSDGVLAVIITIMALELRAPAGHTFADLRQRLPALLIYVLSFAFIGIYWNNHHHLLRATTRISGAVMWTNLHLLFWLSLIPVLTEWIGTDYSHAVPAATYSTVALAAAMAYTLLVTAIVRTEGSTSKVATAIGRDVKGWLSIALYTAAIGFAFLSPWITYGLLTAVAIGWFIPDRRLERR